MRLAPDQLAHFHGHGYLVVADLLTDDDLLPVWAEYETRLAWVAESMVATGRISHTYHELPFGERYLAILKEDVGVYQQLEISLPLENEHFPPDAVVFCGPATFRLLTHPRILDVVESIIGPEIYSNPVQHLRLKPPARHVPEAMAANSYVGKTTWHQDMGALMEEANETDVLTVWVAITDAPREMGPLVVMPGSHRKGGGELTLHCPGKGIVAENYIPGQLLGDGEGQKRPIALPVSRGSIVLLHRYTEHAALPNVSDALRWSFDLRYNPVGQATGRPAFPGFVARSATAPDSVLVDPAAWAALWEEARLQLVSGAYTDPIFNATRWEQYRDDPICA